MKNLPIVVLFALIAFYSCKKGASNDKNFSFSYGSSFGFCVGYCQKSLAISGDNLTYVQKTNNDTKPPITCSGILSPEDRKELYALVNTEDIQKLPEVSGCPDCADGGAEWITISDGGKPIKKTFDYQNPSNSVEKLVIKLRALTASFKDCK